MKRMATVITTFVLATECPGLPPIIKWPGGKERELPHITANLPEHYERYFEPFVGGGSVFAAMSAKEYFINDKSEELMSLYEAIKQQDLATFETIRGIDDSWAAMRAFVHDNMSELVSIYGRMREDAISRGGVQEELNAFLDMHFSELLANLKGLPQDLPKYRKELRRNVVQKFLRMKKIEAERGKMPDSDIGDNIYTAFLSSLYMYCRNIYNCIPQSGSKSCKTALFVFLRNYAYSGMFRYNDKGEFNVPYGGIGYNAKSMRKKLEYYKSSELRERFSKTTLECADFLDFLRKYPPTSEDFVFLDPPYDTEFSSYANNSFDRSDQKRLADYLTGECKGKWMMIIKNTPFIYSLYDGHGLTIKPFGKKYQVSFMNRNDRNVEHLIIRNY